MCAASGKTVLFDTDVLIWVFRGNLKAAHALEAQDGRFVSIVTYMELVQGARNRKEVRQIKDFLGDAAVTVIPLTENIGHRASIYIEEYGLGTAMGVADALIAATAVEHHLPLCTANHRHYRPIKKLEINVFQLS